MCEYGKPSTQCGFCKAELWFQERATISTTNNVCFSLCCPKEKVQLLYLQKPPKLLYSLVHGSDARSIRFKENIRAYNSMFSFISIGGKLQSSINDGASPPQFILSSQNYHRIGSLLPEKGCKPKFAQLYT